MNKDNIIIDIIYLICMTDGTYLECFINVFPCIIYFYLLARLSRIEKSKGSNISKYIPANPLHNCDIASKHFNNFLA